MLNHGFLILAHNHPKQLLDILRHLESSNHYFFINYDAKNSNCRLIANEIQAKIPNTYFIHREIAHGGYSLIKCTIELLEFAQKAGMDYVHLISGQDYPCRNNPYIDSFFSNNNGRSYMYFDNEEKHLLWQHTKYAHRVTGWFFNDMPWRSNKFVNNIVKFLNYIGSRIRTRKPIPGIRAGWQWFSWHSTVVRYVLKQYTENPNFFTRFKYTSCCDELVFHTLLYPHLEELNIESTTALRYINWVKKDINRGPVRSPLVLNENEYSDIINSDAIFCRKIDPVISKNLIELLNNSILGSK